MIKFPYTVIPDDLPELEIEAIEAYVVKESIELVEEELEYFFSHKLQLLGMLSRNIDFERINLNSLQNKLNEILLPQDLEFLLAKIQKRVVRELKKANCSYCFHLSSNSISEDLPQIELAIQEQFRTLKLSRAVAREIDRAWNQTCKKVLPKTIASVGMKVGMGDYLVSILSIGTKKLEDEITVCYLKAARATLKQYQLELMNKLIKEITTQLFKCHNHSTGTAETLKQPIYA